MIFQIFYFLRFVLNAQNFMRGLSPFLIHSCFLRYLDVLYFFAIFLRTFNCIFEIFRRNHLVFEKVLHKNYCKALKKNFRFTGPSASQLELDFSHLLRTGRLSKPTIYNPGYNPPSNQKRTLSFQACPTRENESKKKISGKLRFL